MNKVERLGYGLVAAFMLTLAACGGGGNSPAVDNTPPQVASTTPAGGATGVAVTATVSATFSEAMNAASLDSASFSLRKNGLLLTNVTGTVVYSGTVATFTPAVDLAYASTYTAIVSATVQDAAGNAMVTDYSWSFTTQDPPPPYNDTGISSGQCYETGSDLLVACDSAGAVALNAAQDGMVGRDANPATNTGADGRLGFNFTGVTVGNDHCVRDNVTGLTWELKTADGGMHHWANAYTNYGDNSAGDTSTLVNDSNTASFCGYNDWRLPTADELHSLVDYSVAIPGPTIDTTWFPRTVGGYYWTGSSLANVATSAWMVAFYDGSVTYNGRNAQYLARLVRGVRAPALPRYTPSADGLEVTDKLTKLIWRRCAEGMTYDPNASTCTGTATGYTQETALQLAATAAASSGVAWRLPSVKELESLVDRSVVPAIDASAFPATPSFVFWASTPNVDTPANAWKVNFGNGIITGDIGRGGSYYVRLVRDAP